MTKGNPGARRLRIALFLAAGAVLLAYGGIVAVLAISESTLVYVSAGEGRRGRPVPEADASTPWDTLRVRAHDGVPAFLLVSPPVFIGGLLLLPLEMDLALSNVPPPAQDTVAQNTP